MTPPRTIAWVDVESTNLPPNDYRPWEISLLIRDSDKRSAEITLLIEDIDLSAADPVSLAIGRFDERHGRVLNTRELRVTEAVAAGMVQTWTRGATIVAAQPQFDVGCLEPMLLRHGLKPAWHRRLRDIESITAGYLGYDPGGLQDCADALGIRRDRSQAHTAHGDVMLMKEIWDRIMHSRVPSAT